MMSLVSDLHIHVYKCACACVYVQYIYVYVGFTINTIGWNKCWYCLMSEYMFSENALQILRLGCCCCPPLEKI